MRGSLMPWRRRHVTDVAHPAADPFAELHDRMSRMMEEFLGGAGETPAAFTGRLTPRVDVSETDEELRIEAELPGVREEDVEVSLSDGLLTISGEHRTEEEREEEKGWHVRELVRGSFHRTIPLPSEVEADAVEARFTDGVLRIRAPRRAGTGARRIPVGSGD